MTNEQALSIEQMRLSGKSVLAIANALDVPSNTVKSYLRRHPLAERYPDTCLCCGKPLMMTAHKRKKKFCSDACRMKWWNSHPEQIKRQAVYRFACRGCGKEFTAYGNDHRKYCSHECYIKDRFGRAAV